MCWEYIFILIYVCVCVCILICMFSTHTHVHNSLMCVWRNALSCYPLSLLPRPLEFSGLLCDFRGVERSWAGPCVSEWVRISFSPVNLWLRTVPVSPCAPYTVTSLQHLRIEMNIPYLSFTSNLFHMSKRQGRCFPLWVFFSCKQLRIDCYSSVIFVRIANIAMSHIVCPVSFTKTYTRSV